MDILDAEVVPTIEELGHNPNADEAERLAMRSMDVQQFIKDRAEGKAPITPPVPPPVHITREQVIQLAQVYGLALHDPEGQSGVTLGRIAQLEQENAALLTRAQVAEGKVTEVVAAHEALKGRSAASSSAVTFAGLDEYAPAEPVNG